MKKSEAYHLAQIAVFTAPTIAPENKIEILRVLFEREDLELILEKEGEMKCDTLITE